MARFSARATRLYGEAASTRKGLRSGRGRGRQKDTVLLRQRTLSDPAVVGAKQPRHVVEAEELGALPAPLDEARPKLGVAPESPDAIGHLLGVVGVEDHSGVADHVGKPGRG